MAEADGETRKLEENRGKREVMRVQDNELASVLNLSHVSDLNIYVERGAEVDVDSVTEKRSFKGTFGYKYMLR